MASSDAPRGPPAESRIGRILLRREATWREGHGPECDDERAAGARERGAERLDGTPVRLDGGPDEHRDHAAWAPAEA